MTSIHEVKLEEPDTYEDQGPEEPAEPQLFHAHIPAEEQLFNMQPRGVGPALFDQEVKAEPGIPQHWCQLDMAPSAELPALPVPLHHLFSDVKEEVIDSDHYENEDIRDTREELVEMDSVPKKKHRDVWDDHSSKARSSSLLKTDRAFLRSLLPLVQLEHKPTLHFETLSRNKSALVFSFLPAAMLKGRHPAKPVVAAAVCKEGVVGKRAAKFKNDYPDLFAHGDLLDALVECGVMGEEERHTLKNAASSLAARVAKKLTLAAGLFDNTKNLNRTRFWEVFRDLTANVGEEEDENDEEEELEEAEVQSSMTEEKPATMEIKTRRRWEKQWQEEKEQEKNDEEIMSISERVHEDTTEERLEMACVKEERPEEKARRLEAAEQEKQARVEKEQEERRREQLKTWCKEPSDGWADWDHRLVAAAHGVKFSDAHARYVVLRFAQAFKLTVVRENVGWDSYLLYFDGVSRAFVEGRQMGGKCIFLHMLKQLISLNIIPAKAMDVEFDIRSRSKQSHQLEMLNELIQPVIKPDKRSGAAQQQETRRVVMCMCADFWARPPHHLTTLHASSKGDDHDRDLLVRVVTRAGMRCVIWHYDKYRELSVSRVPREICGREEKSEREKGKRSHLPARLWASLARLGLFPYLEEVMHVAGRLRNTKVWMEPLVSALASKLNIASRLCIDNAVCVVSSLLADEWHTQPIRVDEVVSSEYVLSIPVCSMRGFIWPPKAKKFPLAEKSSLLPVKEEKAREREREREKEKEREKEHRKRSRRMERERTVEKEEEEQTHYSPLLEKRSRSGVECSPLSMPSVSSPLSLLPSPCLTPLPPLPLLTPLRPIPTSPPLLAYFPPPPRPLPTRQVQNAWASRPTDWRPVPFRRCDMPSALECAQAGAFLESVAAQAGMRVVRDGVGEWATASLQPPLGIAPWWTRVTHRQTFDEPLVGVYIRDVACHSLLVFLCRVGVVSERTLDRLRCGQPVTEIAHKAARLLAALRDNNHLHAVDTDEDYLRAIVNAQRQLLQ